MRWLLLFLPLFASAHEPAWNGPWRGYPELISVLQSIPEGKKILEKTMRKNPNFLSQLHVGKASYTESTFVRTYSLLDGEERIEIHHELTLNEKLPLAEAVVDLAHELLHFTEKGMLDPYKEGFTLKEFVRNGIEGPGGELLALAEECKVAWSLEKAYRKYPVHVLCSAYHASNGGFDYAKAKRDYYAVGSWLKEAPGDLVTGVPELNDRPVRFTSSYAAKPYPVALTQEFAETRRAACANNRRKYRLIAAQTVSDRRPASGSLVSERDRLKRFEEKFCRESK